MEASPLDLELTVLSCRDLKAFNFFQKLSLYTAVSIVSDPATLKTRSTLLRHQRQKTPIDRVGNCNPEWNHKLSFDLSPFKSSSSDSNKFPGNLLVKFEVRCEGTVLGKRTVGEALVPLSNLFEEFQGARRFLSYQVKSGEGRSNGVLNFSYLVNGKPIKINATTDNQKAGATRPSPRNVQRDIREISYPSIDINDVRSTPALIPPVTLLSQQQTTPPSNNNVFYVPSHNICNCYTPHPPAPILGYVPREYYPINMGVSGYGHHCWVSQNQFRN